MLTNNKLGRIVQNRFHIINSLYIVQMCRGVSVNEKKAAQHIAKVSNVKMFSKSNRQEQRVCYGAKTGAPVFAHTKSSYRRWIAKLDQITNKSNLYARVSRSSFFVISVRATIIALYRWNTLNTHIFSPADDGKGGAINYTLIAKKYSFWSERKRERDVDYIPCENWSKKVFILSRIFHKSTHTCFVVNSSRKRANKWIHKWLFK